MRPQEHLVVLQSQRAVIPEDWLTSTCDMSLQTETVLKLFL